MIRYALACALLGALLIVALVAPVWAGPLCNIDVMRPCAPVATANPTSPREARRIARGERL
jgi:hypothetical protein